MRGHMGFDDLLTRLDSALQHEGGEQLAEAIRLRYPVAMIDEFQDTDPQQYRIFQAIYRCQPEDALPESQLPENRPAENQSLKKWLVVHWRS